MAKTMVKKKPTTKKKTTAKTTAESQAGLATCAYCGGGGIDPFGIPSERSKCQVCGGRGKVRIEKPIIECAFCRGTGIYPDKRITCTACMGKGVVKAVKNPTTCPECEGTGESESTPGLYCVRCKGKGVIEG